MALNNFKRTDIIVDKIDRSLDEITPLKAQQGEYNGRYLRVQLTNGGIIEPQTADVQFGFRHNDNANNGIVVAKKTDPSKGIYDIYYPTEMTREAGVVICQLKIIETTGSQKKEISLTSDFKVTVARSIITGQMEVAENSITVFDKVLLDIKEHERRVILLETAFGDLYKILNTNIPNMDAKVSSRLSEIKHLASIAALRINTESINYTLKDGTVGLVLYELTQDSKKPQNRDVLKTLNRIGEIATSNAAMDVIFASNTAIKVIASSSTAMYSMGKSPSAMDKIINSNIAIDEIVNSSNVMGVLVRLLNAFNKMANSTAVMKKITESTIAMDKIVASNSAMDIITESSIAMNQIVNSRMAMDKVVKSDAAMSSIAFSDIAIDSILNSHIAIESIAGSTHAMEKMIDSDETLKKIAGSNLFLDELYKRKSSLNGRSRSYSGKVIVLEISNSNAFSEYHGGYAILSDGSKPEWSDYKHKYSYFKKYPKYAKYIENDVDSDDYIYYYKIK